MNKKRVLIIGAGPAGLTAAYELLTSSRSDEFEVIIFEESSYFGGISKTVEFQGNRMDMGGHRFFSKVPEVNQWWEKMLPTQGAKAYDDLKLHRSSTIKEGGPDPQKEANVMLRRKRVSRIYFKNKFFDYPVTLNWETFKNMGFGTTIAVGGSYLKSIIFKRKEKSLEDFYINRFGKKLYSMFFENYTENLWGRHPSKISPEWGAQRVKGVSIFAILKDIFGKMLKKSNRKVETSLIEEFAYPKYGPGQLWELTAEKIKKMEGTIELDTPVKKIKKNENNEIEGVIVEKEGKEEYLPCDILISSMPLKDLIEGMNDVPKREYEIASNLPYRDYITVGVLVSKLNLKNETKIKTLGNIVPDNWVYVHNRNVKMGRFQIYNNWSPYLVKDPENTVWMGLEYFCNEGDKMWELSDDDFARKAIKEMVRMDLISDSKCVTSYHVERVKKAYPAYFDSYEHFDELRSYLDSIPNLYCVGRNGQHRYNNLDHSMCTSFEAVKNILQGKTDKSNIWNINTEQEYHEQK